MTETVIRPVTLADAPLLAEIHAASFGDSAWSAEQIAGSLALETTKGWIAGENGVILCQMTTERTEVLTFGVRPESRRRGIGKALLQQALAAASASGSSAFFLEAAADNRPARALYEKLGFQETGTRPGYYKRGGIAVDAVFYEKNLVRQ